jgi:hypothetical protein
MAIEAPMVIPRAWLGKLTAVANIALGSTIDKAYFHMNSSFHANCRAYRGSTALPQWEERGGSLSRLRAPRENRATCTMLRAVLSSIEQAAASAGGNHVQGERVQQQRKDLQAAQGRGDAVANGRLDAPFQGALRLAGYADPAVTDSWLHNRPQAETDPLDTAPA